jgi:hypothetical protein
MPFAENYMVTGSFTVPTTVSTTVSATQNINCGFIPTRVELVDQTALASMAGGPPIINPGSTYLGYRWTWNSGGNFTLTEGMAPAASVTNVPVVSNGYLTTTGISSYNGAAASPTQLVLGTKITGSTFAKSTGTFTVSSTATLYAGATILMTGFTVDKQLGGMLFTINTIASTTTFTIANSSSWLNTSSFTGGAQTFNVQLVTTPSLYFPASAQIVNISAANPAVITTSTNLGLTAGQQVRLYVPKAFGMTQANFTTAVISATSGNQITLGGASAAAGGGFGVSNGLNSSAFTAFSWPLATGVPYTPAYVVPIGSGPYPDSLGYFNSDTLQDATINTAFQGFTVGSGILIGASSTVIGVTASDVIYWTAWRGDV